MMDSCNQQPRRLFGLRSANCQPAYANNVAPCGQQFQPYAVPACPQRPRPLLGNGLRCGAAQNNCVKNNCLQNNGCPGNAHPHYAHPYGPQMIPMQHEVISDKVLETAPEVQE
ncbi:MAG TPA: hypothetical protein DEB39_05040 [Planctomycetaceae bacterium]|nr:hypothetical protein [Planctomycetaceae bacterium]